MINIDVQNIIRTLRLNNFHVCEEFEAKILDRDTDLSDVSRFINSCIFNRSISVETLKSALDVVRKYDPNSYSILLSSLLLNARHPAETSLKLLQGGFPASEIIPVMGLYLSDKIRVIRFLKNFFSEYVFSQSIFECCDYSDPSLLFSSSFRFANMGGFADFLEGALSFKQHNFIEVGVYNQFVFAPDGHLTFFSNKGDLDSSVLEPYVGCDGDVDDDLLQILQDGLLLPNGFSCMNKFTLSIYYPKSGDDFSNTFRACQESYELSPKTYCSFIPIYGFIEPNPLPFKEALKKGINYAEKNDTPVIFVLN